MKEFSSLHDFRFFLRQSSRGEMLNVEDWDLREARSGSDPGLVGRARAHDHALQLQFYSQVHHVCLKENDSSEFRISAIYLKPQNLI